MWLSPVVSKIEQDLGRNRDLDGVWEQKETRLEDGHTVDIAVLHETMCNRLFEGFGNQRRGNHGCFWYRYDDIYRGKVA